MSAYPAEATVVADRGARRHADDTEGVHQALSPPTGSGVAGGLRLDGARTRPGTTGATESPTAVLPAQCRTSVRQAPIRSRRGGNGAAYDRRVDQRILLDEATLQAWVTVAHEARWYDRVLATSADPGAGSNFDLIDAHYRYELASSWHRSYLTAALEHLLLWAEMVAPLKFHPDQVTIHRLRPTYTLARAALESAAHAVWLSGGDSAEECARRHLRLIRWDYDEHAKSVTDPEQKSRIRSMDNRLLSRVSEHLSEADLRPPGLLDVLRWAAEVIGVSPADVERVWRAASGATHGKYWPNLALQHVVPVEEYAPGQLRTVSVPDPAGMTEALELAVQMTGLGVARHVQFGGLELQPVLDEARRWLATVVPFRDDADPEVIAHLQRGEEGPDSRAPRRGRPTSDGGYRP